MIPLQDLNPTRRIPFITYLLIVTNVLVFLWEWSLPDQELQRVFLDDSVVPYLVTRAPLTETILDLVRSMFFHGGWAHLLGNMLYLYLFGDNLEDRLGIPIYLFLYFVSGAAAALGQILVDPASQIPLVGASGAISGVLGGYLILFPGVRVRGVIPFGYYFHRVEWPAIVVLGLWFVMQLFSGLFSMGGQEGGVAFFAHVGGFVAGIVLMWIFLLFVPQPPRDERYAMLYERARRYPF